jgi:hypothetical protein
MYSFNKKYDPEWCNLAVALMSTGKSKTQVAAAIGITKQNLYSYAKTHEDFAHALELGQTLAEAKHIEHGENGMLGNIKNFNIGAFQILAWLKFGLSSGKTETINVHTNSTLSEAAAAEVEARVLELVGKPLGDATA